MSQPIDFYFEFASPYGYLASTRIDRIAEHFGREVRWHPVMLGAAFVLVGAWQTIRPDARRVDAEAVTPP